MATKSGKTVSAGSRIYYIDTHTDGNGHGYISVAEMNLRTKKRTCIFIHPEDFGKIVDALNETIKELNGKENPDIGLSRHRGECQGND